MANVKAIYRLENKKIHAPNGGKNVKIMSNVRGTTESAVMSELQWRVHVDENHTLVLVDYRVL